MVSRAAPTHSTDENEVLPTTFTHFINCDNVGMAQHDLIHQFKDLGYMDVSFASGTTQALYMGEFFTQIQAPQVTSQSLLSTNKSQIQTSVRMTTSSATCFKSKDKRSL